MVLFIPAASECLKGVWEVSGGCLSDSGYSLEGGGRGVQAIDKNPIRFIFIIS